MVSKVLGFQRSQASEVEIYNAHPLLQNPTSCTPGTSLQRSPLPFFYIVSSHRRELFCNSTFALEWHHRRDQPHCPSPHGRRISSPVSSSSSRPGKGKEFSDHRKPANIWQFPSIATSPTTSSCLKVDPAYDLHRVSFEIAVTFSPVTRGPNTGELLPNKTFLLFYHASSSTYPFMYCFILNHVLSPTMLRWFCVVAFQHTRIPFSPRNATDPPTKGLTPSPTRK